MEKKLHVLILYQFQEHENLLLLLKEKVKLHNIEISLFNTRTFKFSENPQNYWFLQFLVKLPKIRVFVYNYFRTKIVLSLSSKYDIIDIHYFSTIYDFLFEKLNHPKVKISFWGSDAYRITDERKKKLNTITAPSKCIRFNTIEMFTKMEKYFDKKEILGHQIFGNSFFELINVSNKNKTEAKKKVAIPSEKISVFVGYNASKGQQHELILNQLKDLPVELKNQIILVLPLTYGADRKTKETIRALAQSTGIETKCFVDTLNQEEISFLRLSSDIVINFQISDAFSASLQEHFYTNSIMILGAWLPYDWLSKEGLFFYSIHPNELIDLLSRIIQDIDIEKVKFNSNNVTISSISSWESVSRLWADDYRQMLN